MFCLILDEEYRLQNNFRKEETLHILFSDEMLAINSLYNPQNGRIWAINRGETDGKGGVKQKQKFPQKVMVWLGVSSEDNAIGNLGERNDQPQSLYRKSFASSSKIRQPSPR